MMRGLVLGVLLLASPPVRGEVGDTQLGVSGPLMLVDGSAYWGTDALVLHRIHPKWELGGETGFHYWRKSYAPGVSSSSWVIPILPTALIHINAGLPTFHPFAGLGFGVAWIHRSVSIGAISSSDSSVKLEMLAHAGARFGRKRRFFADLRFGLLDGLFVFTPSLGWFFSL